jgi:hypothetical protein
LVAKALLAGEVILTYGRVRRLLRQLSVPETLAVLRREPVSPRPLYVSPSAARLGAIVQRVLRWVPGDTRCLTQSLVLTALLARRNVRSELLIAVSVDRGFGAHAWVEHDGHALLPPGRGAWQPIVQL